MSFLPQFVICIGVNDFPNGWFGWRCFQLISLVLLTSNPNTSQLDEQFSMELIDGYFNGHAL